MMKIAFRVIFIFKMASDKIGKISLFSNFNANWYLGLFWSEELIGNDENCIQGHFYDATVSKMATNKIDKLLMVSDFNENWYLGVFWSEELVGNDETCIHMPEFRYGGRLGTSVFASKHNQTLLLLSLPNNVWRLIVFAPFLIIIKSPKQILGDLLFLLRFLLLSLLLLLFLFFLSAKHELVHGRSQELQDRISWNLVEL
jgi:hypothetical protein